MKTGSVEIFKMIKMLSLLILTIFSLDGFTKCNSAMEHDAYDAFETVVDWRGYKKAYQLKGSVTTENH